MLIYSAASFVVMQVHQTASLFSWSAFIILFPFTNVDESLRESAGGGEEKAENIN